MCIKKIVWGIKYEKSKSDTPTKLGYTEEGNLSLETIWIAPLKQHSLGSEL